MQKLTAFRLVLSIGIFINYNQMSVEANKHNYKWEKTSWGHHAIRHFTRRIRDYSKSGIPNATKAHHPLEPKNALSQSIYVGLIPRIFISSIPKIPDNHTSDNTIYSESTTDNSAESKKDDPVLPLPGNPSPPKIPASPEVLARMFEAKHVYDSTTKRITEMTSDELKKYILTMDQWLHNFKVLPNIKNLMPTLYKPITIIEGDIETLKRDLKNRKEMSKADDGRLTADYGKNIYVTNKKYPLIQIEFAKHESSGGIVVNVHMLEPASVALTEQDGKIIRYHHQYTTTGQPGATEVQKPKKVDLIRRIRIDESDMDTHNKIKSTLLDNRKKDSATSEKQFDPKREKYVFDVSDIQKARDRTALNIIEEVAKKLGHSPGKREKNYICQQHKKKEAQYPSNCIIIVNDEDKDTSGRKKKIESKLWSGVVAEIRSENLRATYNKMEDAHCRSLFEIIEKNREKLRGDPVSVQSAIQLTENEKLQKHVAKIANGMDCMQSADCFEKKQSFIGYDREDLLQGTKISHSKTAKSLSQAPDKISKEINKGSRVYARYMLGKSFASSVKNGDNVTLIVVGTATVANFFLENVPTIQKYGSIGSQKGGRLFEKKLGAEFAEKATNVLRFNSVKSLTNSQMKVLSVAAGPLGFAIDMSLSSYGLRSAINRYVDPKANLYEQNDALTSIIEGALDITISASVFAASLAFPPFSIVIAATGFLTSVLLTSVATTYKAHNYIGKISSKILLDDSEIFTESGRYLASEYILLDLETSDYLKHLIAIKDLNNDFVNSSIQFLEANKEYIGIIKSSTESMSEQHDSCFERMYGCEFEFFYCWRYTNYIKTNITCHVDGYTYTKNSNDISSGYAYEHYECHCAKKYTLMIPWPNSKVDFREEVDVFLERSVPDDPPKGYHKSCVPSTTSYGGRNVSQKRKTSAFLCEHAIGVERDSNNTKTGSLMLYKLGDGKDEIYLSPKTSNITNLFLVGDGTKLFHGNSDPNIFYITGPCDNLTGVLDGGKGDNNALEIDANCSPSKTISMDLYRHPNILRVPESDVEISVSSTQEIRGRHRETERIICGCDTKIVSLNGGQSIANPDSITILQDKNCDYNLRVHVNKYTKIFNFAYHGLFQFIIYQEVESYVYAEIDITHFASNSFLILGDLESLQFSIYAFNEHNIKYYNMQLLFAKNQTVEFKFLERSDTNVCKFPHQLITDVGITISGIASAMSSSISINKGTGNVQLWHTLKQQEENPDNISKPLQGVENVSNFYKIFGGMWNISGLSSGQNDTFIIMSIFGGRIQGGKAVNSLNLTDEIDCETVVADLSRGSLYFWENELLQSVEISNIQMVHGRKDKSDIITCGCQTMYISGNGGQSARAPDIISIPENQECSYDVTIVAEKFTKVVNSAKTGKFRYEVDDSSNYEIDFELKYSSSNIFLLKLSLQNILVEWNVTTLDVKNFFNYKIHFKFSEIQILKFDFNSMLTPNANETLEPQIFFIDPTTGIQSLVIFRADEPQLQILHVLNVTGFKNDTMVFNGVEGVSNYFELLGGSWIIFGGKNDDVFSLQSISFKGDIEGGGGSDTLQLHSNLGNVPLTIDFNSERIIKQDNEVDVDSDEFVRLSGISRVEGRKGVPETIICSCSIEFVNGGGGTELEHDVINIPFRKDCKYNITTIIVKPFTEVNNLATTGSFVYSISREEELSLIKVVSTEGNSHLFQFFFGNDITAVYSNKTKGEVSFSTVSGNTLSYKMEYIDTNIEGEYKHPKFQLYVTDTYNNTAIWDIRVSNNGLVKAKIEIHRPFHGSIKGWQGALNTIIINSTEAKLDIVEGNKNSDFHIQCVNSINILDGVNGSVNRLKIYESCAVYQPLTIDLRKSNGSIYLTNTPDIFLIKTLKNINVYEGRESLDSIYTDCSTIFVKGPKDIFIGDPSCSNYSMTIVIQKDTSVTFTSIEDDEDDDSNIFASGRFYYKFETLRSFNLIFDYWQTLRNTTHIFYLNFNITDLENITFSKNESKLIYSIANNSYHHLIDVDELGDFYSQPQFVTFDGFQIQVSRFGNVFMVLTQPEKDNSIDKIQNETVSLYGAFANKLCVTIIIYMKNDFLYVGHSGVTVDNILTNMYNTTSHLLGMGAPGTVYAILESNSNVYIYPGLEDNSNSTQILDLRDVVWPIREATNTKYVPKVVQVENDLVITMKDAPNSTFTGKIIIVGGALLAARIQVLLCSSAMKLVSVGSLESRNRPIRSLSSEWKIQASPIPIQEGTVVILTEDDLEEGQEHASSVPIVGCTSTINNQDNSNDAKKRTTIDNEFCFSIRNKTDFFYSNIRTLNISTNATTFIIIDGFRKGLGSKLNVTLNIGGNIFQINIPDDTTNIKTWEEILEEVENKILEGMPEIKRKFTVKREQKEISFIFLFAAISVITSSLTLFFVFIICKAEIQKMRR